jgi:hypothetical protein
MTRSLFELARPTAPPRPRWGIGTVHPARHLFREHCRATPEPMAHSRWRRGMDRRGIVGSVRREIRIVLKVLAGQQAAASQEVGQARPRVWRGRTEPEGLAGQGR